MHQKELISLTQEAYKQYRNYTNGVDVLGRDVPVWEALPEVLQGAWTLAIDVALRHVVVESNLRTGQTTIRTEGL